MLSKLAQENFGVKWEDELSMLLKKGGSGNILITFQLPNR